MMSAPFTQTSCILLPTVNSDRLLQQLTGLLRSVGQHNSTDSTRIGDGGGGQPNHVIQLLPSSLIQPGSTVKEVTLSNGLPSLISIPSGGVVTATSTGPFTVSPLLAGSIAPPTTATVPIEVINAILRLPETVVASTSSVANLRPVETSSTGPPLSNKPPAKAESSEIPSQPREGSESSSSHLLHRLLTGEDANRVRSRSVLLLTDQAKWDSNESKDKVVDPPTINNQPTTSEQAFPMITVAQLLALLPEVCRKMETLGQTSDQQAGVNALLLKQLLPLLVNRQNTVPAQPIREQPAVARCPSSPPGLHPTSRVQGHGEGDFLSRLTASEFTRPRSHSDHQPNRRQQLQQEQALQRPRCYSKAERRRLRPSGPPTDCDPGSSLFAKLVLTPEPSWSTRTTATSSSTSSSLSPTPPPPETPAEARRRRPKAACCLEDCRQVLHWLRDSDEFVSQQCTGIPRHSLVLTATNGDVKALPQGTRTVLVKLWHQLLLVSMMEKRFVFSVAEESTATTTRNGVVETSGAEGDFGTDVFVSQLRAIIATGVGLNLGPRVYKAVRLALLAQAAYPDHYPHSYAKQLSDLEEQLTATTEKEESQLIGTLRLLSQLHSIDANTLKALFRLPTASQGHHDGDAIAQPARTGDMNKSKGQRHGQPGSANSATTVSPTGVPPALVGASKRKATAASRRRFGSTTEESVQLPPPPTTESGESLPRSRANTVTGTTTPSNSHTRQCKSARMS